MSQHNKEDELNKLNTESEDNSSEINSTVTPASPTLPVEGDVNGDGRLTAADSRLILRNVNGYDDGLSDEQIGIMDSNGDGTVDVSDAKGSLEVSAKLTDFDKLKSTAATDTNIAVEEPEEDDNPNKDILDRYLEEYAAIGDFEYDPNNDLAQYYGRQYRNAALLNQQNALASGGTGYSSTKQALANSAYNSTIEQLGDVQTDLYQLALDAYQQERANALQDVELARTLYNDAEDREYQQWYMDNTEAEQERDQSNIEADRGITMASLAASYGNYDRLAELTGLDFSSQETRDKFNDAYSLFQATGDLSGLKNMGIDTSYLEAERKKEDAVLAASYGDYSGLAALGIDISKITRDDDLQIALYLAEYGNFDKLEEVLGADLSDAEFAAKLEIGITAAQSGDYSYLEAMGFDTSFLKQLNNLQLTSSSGSGGGSSSSSSENSGTKYISDDTLKTAVEVFNVRPEEFEYYCNNLYSKGYTDEQIAYIKEYVHDYYFSDEASYVMSSVSDFASRLSNLFG